MSSLVVALLILSTAPDLQRIDDPARGFSFRLPTDFVELPGFEKPAPTVRTGTLGTWVRGLEQDDFVIVSLEGLAGTIGREPVDLTGQRGAAQLKEQWRSFEVDGLRLIRQQEDGAMVVLAVQVPLTPNALQVMSSGRVENEPAVHEALVGVLASLEGKSSWLTDEERVAAGLEGALRLGVTFLVIAALASLAWRVARKKR